MYKVYQKIRAATRKIYIPGLSIIKRMAYPTKDASILLRRAIRVSSCPNIKNFRAPITDISANR